MARKDYVKELMVREIRNIVATHTKNFFMLILDHTKEKEIEDEIEHMINELIDFQSAGLQAQAKFLAELFNRTRK